MSVEWIAGLMVVLAIASLGGAALLFFRHTWFLQWLRGTAGFLLAGLALWFAFFAASLFSYERVEAGKPLATVSFTASGEHAWDVAIATAAGDRFQYDLRGDLWQLDLRLLRWKGVFSGAQPLFVPERLSGRYVSLEDEATLERTEHNLLPGTFLGYDLWERVDGSGSLALSASRAGVVLVPIADGAIFEVQLGDSGLVAAPANSAAEAALKQVTGG